MAEELKACRNCGGKCDPKGWMRGDGLQGPECEGCGITTPDVESWNRLMGDQLPSQGGEAVAWRVTGRDGLTVTAQYPEWAEADCLLTITPLYTHPADQVAELKAILTELDGALEDLELHGRHSDQGYRKLKDWYRKVALITDRIDALLTKSEVAANGA